jgi:hypothetical protein
MSLPYPSPSPRPIQLHHPQTYIPAHAHGCSEEESHEGSGKAMQDLCGICRRVSMRAYVQVDEREYEEAVIDERPGQ